MNKKYKKNTIVFIVGSGRSGSTILDLSIGANSQCFSVGEIVDLHKEFLEDRWCTCGERYSSCIIWRNIYDYLKKNNTYSKGIKFPSKNSFKFINHIHNIICMFKSNKVSRLCAKANEYLYRNIFKNINETKIIDSSKDIKRAIILYRHMGLNCKIIHLIRDVRGVAYSGMKTSYSVALPPDYITKKYPAKEIRTVEQSVHVWNKQNTLIGRMLNIFVKKQDHITIRYEDLTQNPVETLGNICEWLQIASDDDMLNFGHKIHHNIGGNPSRFNSSSIKKLPEQWRVKLTQDEILYCTQHAKKLLHYHGYL